MARRQTITREEVKELGRLDRIWWGHFFLPKEFRAQNAPSHYEVNQLLNESWEKIAIMCHRYWAKSTILSYVLPLHRACYNPRGKHEFISLIAESQPQSKNHLVRIRTALESNHRIHKVYGDLVSGARSWGSTELVTNNNVRINAFGTGQRLRSMIEVGGRRPTLTILDDFESEENAETPEARRKNLKWLYAVVLPFRDRGGRIVATQSPVSPGCAIFRLMSDDQWRAVRVPLYEVDEETGNIIPNWPSEWPLDRILKERKSYANQDLMGIFNQEYLLIPFKTKGIGIDESDIRWYEGELKKDRLGITYIENFVEINDNGERVTEPVDMVVNVFAGCDPAIGADKIHDFIADVAIGMNSQKDFIILNDSIYKNASPWHQGQEFAEFAWDCRAKGVGVEAVQFQAAVGEAANAWCDDHNVSFDFVRGFQPRTRKDVRLNWWANKFKSRRVFMRKGRAQLLQQHLDFPDTRSHDDALDACYMAAKIAYPPSIESIEELRRRKRRQIDPYDRYTGDTWYDSIPTARVV